MSDQVDEDALSVQLESSLTLQDGELSIHESSNESLASSKEIKNILDNIVSPTKAIPLKVDKDLRKEVLIRNLKTTPNKDKGDSIESMINNQSKERLVQPHHLAELKNDNQDADAKVDTDVKKPKDHDKMLKLGDENFIIIDESVADSSISEIATSLPLSPKKDEKEEKPIKKPSGLDVDYISKDPLENADNNNPDWLLLKKLETDEERYKAVRERWRNLIVPEPNKDLTCFTWCRNKFVETKNLNEKPTEDELKYNSDEDIQNKGRKRTFSDCTVDSPVRRGREAKNTEKRVRTISCTRIYDDKIAALRRHASEECLRIDREHTYALEDLHREYLSAKRSLTHWSLNTGYSISHKLNELDQYHYEKRKNLSLSYEDVSGRAWEKQSSQIYTLEAASAEVLAFHKFYQGLDENAPESMVLTEEQLEEIEEINSMYDAFFRFYEE